MTIQHSLSQVANDLTAILQTRAELFSVELAAQRERFFSLLGLCGIALIFLLLALVIFSILVVSFFWPGEFRFWAIGGLAMLYAMTGLSLTWRLVHRLNTEALPFEFTRQELSKDLALLSAWQSTPSSNSHRAERDSDSQREDFHAR
jgi:uncharacterized membrane protein YqjE